MLPSVFYKKHTELEQEPRQTLTEDEIAADLLIDENDPLFSENVKRIISSNDASSGEKLKILNSKSFRTVEKILQLKEDLLSQKKQLEEKLEKLNELKDSLESFEHSTDHNTQ